MKNDKHGEASRTPAKGRKPYAKPQCVSEKIFETTALACGKLPSGSGNCGAIPKAS